jgi:HD superfamily phosphodiesterase
VPNKRLAALRPPVLAACLAVLTAATLARAGTSQPAAGESWRVSVRQFADTHLKHPAWGVSHSTRDYELAKSLAAADQVTLDDDVLFAAAYLHDVAAFVPYEKAGVDHADQGALIVDTFLVNTDFPRAKIEAVRGAIRTHMFARDPVGPEAIYLHDADALDWLGAIGVARIFALVDPNGGQPDGPAAVKMLQRNLAQVPPRIISKAGRAQSEVRVRELEQFLRELAAESTQFGTL